MTETSQLIRHYRFKETILVQLPQYNSPLEGMITHMTNDGEYACFAMHCNPASRNWAKARDIEVLAILKTPSDLGPWDRPNMQADHAWDGGAL